MVLRIPLCARKLLAQPFNPCLQLFGKPRRCPLVLVQPELREVQGVEQPHLLLGVIRVLDNQSEGVCEEFENPLVRAASPLLNSFPLL